MNVLEFAAQNPWQFFFMGPFILILLGFLYGLLRLPFVLINRILRSVMVSIRGWPPSHLDADGDWKTEEDK